MDKSDFVQALGPGGKRAAYLQPWTSIGYTVSRTRLIGQTVYFFYVPLNQAGRIQHVLDRAKLEYDFRRFRLGAGYAGYKYAEEGWQNRPFLTWSIKAGRAGSFEFWAQRLQARTYQVQLRYLVAFKTK